MLMRRINFLSVIASALLLIVSFTSCDELEGLLNDDEKESSVNGAFFPDSYSQRNVAAWYSLTEEEKGGGKRIESVFLFDDNSFVATKNRIYTDDRSNERTIMAEGDYRIIEGDYTNGKAQVVVNGESAPMLVIITDGVMSAMGQEFVKQDNKKVPKAASETGKGQGGEGQGGGNEDNGIEAFFPTDFSDKTVDAWFSEVGEISEQGYKMQYNASIYFFDDGIFLCTAHTEIEGPQGQITNKSISITGEYTILKGDFTNGDIELKGADGKAMTVEIREGKLTGIEAEGGQIAIYSKQDNGKVPQPSEPTNNGQQGGEGGEGLEYNGDPMPYLPAQYGSKTISAWYLFSNVENGTVRFESVFLFDDGWLVVTKSKFYNTGDGRDPEYGINAEGQYQLTEGSDFMNGTALVVLSDGMTMEVSIQDGILYAMNMEFEIQDNDDAPAPLKL